MDGWDVARAATVGRWSYRSRGLRTQLRYPQLRFGRRRRALYQQTCGAADAAVQAALTLPGIIRCTSASRMRASPRPWEAAASELSLAVTFSHVPHDVARGDVRGAAALPQAQGRAAGADARRGAVLRGFSSPGTDRDGAVRPHRARCGCRRRLRRRRARRRAAPGWCLPACAAFCALLLFASVVFQDRRYVR